MTVTANDLRVLFLKLDRLKIGYHYNKEESFLEIGGVSRKPIFIFLAIIGLVLITLLFGAWIIFLPKKIIPILALVATYSVAFKYLTQYFEQKGNRFKIKSSEITVYQDNQEIVLTPSENYHIRVDIDLPDNSEFNEFTNILLSGRLLLTHNTKEIKLISIHGEDPNLIGDDLRYIHMVIKKIIGINE